MTVAIGDYTRPRTPPRAGSRSPTGRRATSPGLARGCEAAAAGLDWLEKRLGPYPFDSLGFLVVDSRSGMETQTMITLGDTDYTTSPEVLVHEMAHQWYGDKVTPQDWRDVWMNEGMAMYLQGCWQAQADGRTRGRGDGRLRQARGPRCAPRPGRPRRTTRSSSAQGNIYYGPALMWHELRKRIGDDAFWKLVREWPAGTHETNATCDQYLDWWSEETREDRVVLRRPGCSGRRRRRAS